MKFLNFTPALVGLLLAAATDACAATNLTLYLNGAQIEQREIAKKGYLEITVPPGALKDSLRIVPDKGVEIIRVLTTPLKPARNVEKELKLLAEREERLKDRLKALSVREEIFKSAAKSQSAKAPRRTKTNPEPLATIKQGTDYAITQLESVYYSKRLAEKELAQIAERRLRLGKEELSSGTLAKVWITTVSGAVTAFWSQSDRHWTPLYQIRFDDNGSAVLSLSAQGVTVAKGEKAQLVLAPLQAEGAPARFRYESEWNILKKEAVKVTGTQKDKSAPFAVSITNSSSLNLPPGEISCFKSGVYIGKGSFAGVESGKSTEIVCSSG